MDVTHAAPCNAIIEDRRHLCRQVEQAAAEEAGLLRVEDITATASTTLPKRADPASVVMTSAVAWNLAM